MAQIILDSNNNLIQGDFDNATVNNRTKFKTTTLNGTTNVYAVPNGSSTSAGYSVSNAADPTNASKITIATNGATDTQIISGINGTGTYLPLSFYTNNALGMQLSTAGVLTVTGGVAGSSLPAGSVIQVVNVTYSVLVSTTGTTYIDTGLSASITPTSSSNKILVIVHQSECGCSNANVGMALQLLRNSTSIVVIGPANAYGPANANASISTAYLDSPATTSAVTYKTQFKLNSASGTAVVQSDTATSTITLMEIKG